MEERSPDMQVWIDQQKNSSAMLELPRDIKRRRGPRHRLRMRLRRLAHRRWDLVYLIVPAVPIATLFLLMYARYWELASPRLFLVQRLDLFYAALVTNTLMAFGLSCWCYILFSERRNLSERLSSMRLREKTLSKSLLRLQKEMELLTAMRDLSRIINDDVQFEAIWTQVLDVLGSLVDCKRITIFMLDEERQPVARILHHRFRTRFGKDISANDLDLTNVCETLKHRCVLRLAEGENLFWTYPLMADGAVQGVLQIKAGIGGDVEEKVRRIDQHEETIHHLLKHISLALKTPTLYDRAVIDGLTGLFTKRHFLSQLNQLSLLNHRIGGTFSLIFSDIDFFKAVNDTHGHMVGDQCLQAIAKVIKEQARTCDMAFRYGGEEMCLLLPETTQDHAIVVAERIHQAIATEKIQLPDGSSLSCTASIGVAQFDNSMKTAEALVAKADEALYEAKEQGRNQIFCWSDDQLVRTPNSPRKKLKRPAKAVPNR